jgi:hypothetical protein
VERVATVGARISRELSGVRNYAEASRGNTSTKIVLPALWRASTFPAHHSTHGALSTVSCYDSPLSLFHWMLDFSLAPWFQLVSIQENSIHTGFLPLFQLALVGVLVVQCLQICLQNSVFNLVVRLKFQTNW